MKAIAVKIITDSIMSERLVPLKIHTSNGQTFTYVTGTKNLNIKVDTDNNVMFITNDDGYRWIDCDHIVTIES